MPGPGPGAWVPPQPPDANTFRIFISTDNHLGFAEKHDYPPRQDDSFLAVEEVLENATASKVVSACPAKSRVQLQPTCATSAQGEALGSRRGTCVVSPTCAASAQGEALSSRRGTLAVRNRGAVARQARCGRTEACG